MMINDHWWQKLYRRFFLWLTTNWLQQLCLFFMTISITTLMMWRMKIRRIFIFASHLSYLSSKCSNLKLQMGNQDAVVNTAMQSACGRSYVQSPQLRLRLASTKIKLFFWFSKRLSFTCRQKWCERSDFYRIHPVRCFAAWRRKQHNKDNKLSLLQESIVA